ncbi:hypothetical protein CVT24_002403, partial [Panaeolus cyanescens]
MLTKASKPDRLAIFTQLAVSAVGCSSLLAYVLDLMDGTGGLAGWRWIFIIEALITIVLAVLTYFYFPDFPDQNHFLTEEQTKLVLERLNEDRGDALPDPITFEKVKQHLLDWKIWTYGMSPFQPRVILPWASSPSVDAQAFFLPIILMGMGWSKTAALLLSVPPYGPTIIISVVLSYFSDKYKHQASFMVGGTIVCIVGLSLTAFAKQDAV